MVRKDTPHSQPPLTLKGAIWMTLLIFQCGLQPYLSKHYIPENFDMKVFVFVTETLKIIFCLLALLVTGNLKESLEGWTAYHMFVFATPPSIIYTVQSVLTQLGYKLADPLTANLLQQTKMISSAFFIWLLLGMKQTKAQIAALGGIFLGVSILSLDSAGQKADSSATSGGGAQLGAFYLLVCCLLSGLATGMVQKILWGKKRNSYLYSMELAVISLLTLLFVHLSKFVLAGGVIQDDGSGWQWNSNKPEEGLLLMVPLLNSALGGIIVGQVTAVVGGVWKGIALILGICFAGIFRYFVDSTPLSDKMIFAFPLIVISSWVHLKNPYVPDT